MLEGLKHAHSGFRWILLLILIVVIINAILKWKNNESYKIKDRLLSTITLIITHSMVLLGVALYFMGNKYDFENKFNCEFKIRFVTLDQCRLTSPLAPLP